MIKNFKYHLRVNYCFTQIILISNFNIITYNTIMSTNNFTILVRVLIFYSMLPVSCISCMANNYFAFIFSNTFY